MNVAIIIPPPLNRVEYLGVQQPLNACYVAAYLRAAKPQCTVQIWDYSAETFNEREFLTRLKDNRIEVAGFSGFTPTIKQCAALASIIKRAYPEIRTVIGGIHVSTLPEGTMREFECFDIGIIGEGERSFAELCGAMDAGADISVLKSVVYRKHGEIIKNDLEPLITDIDEIPFPARDLLKQDLYNRGHTQRGFSRGFMRISEMFTSRGCPGKCIFCASRILHTNALRFHSIGYVEAEIEECVMKYGAEHISLVDDNFTSIPDRVYKICDIFKRHHVTWNCLARINNVNADMLHYMKKSGCEGIVYGIESGSPRILKLIKKGITVEQIIQGMKATHEAGITNIEADFLIGVHPDETVEDIRATVDLIKKIKPTILAVLFCVPYPGTEVWTIMNERGLVNETDWNKYVIYGQTPNWRTHALSAEELVAWQNKIMRDFYYTPGYVLSRIARIRSMREFAYYIKIAYAFSKSLRARGTPLRRTP